jgi:hypothetical protein
LAEWRWRLIGHKQESGLGLPDRAKLSGKLKLDLGSTVDRIFWPLEDEIPLGFASQLRPGTMQNVGLTRAEFGLL